MKSFQQLLILLFIWILHQVKAQSSYYRHEYYSPISPPPPRYFRRSNGFGPVTYTHDLLSEETKHKVSAKKYSKPVPNRTSFSLDDDDFSNERFTSSEFPNDSRGFNSQEQDSHEYTIGTHIHVQHPITVPKKITSSHPKTSKTAAKSNHFNKDVNFSSEIFGPEPPTPSSLKKHKQQNKFPHRYEPDPFHIIPPPKTTSPAIVASSSVGYNVYETDPDEFKPSKKALDRYKEVASAKPIEAFLEDQQKKLLDEALKIQLLNNPEFKQFLKEKEKKRFEKEQRQYYREDDGIISPPKPPNPSLFLENLEEGITFTTQRPRRRPADFKRSPKRKPGTVKPKRKFHSTILIDS